VAALHRLLDRQGTRQIESFGDALPLFFDHRVYKGVARLGSSRLS
jgi:hypothetical protein